MNRFLRNPETMKQLMHYIISEWRKIVLVSRWVGKKVHCTVGEECYEMASDLGQHFVKSYDLHNRKWTREWSQEEISFPQSR